MTNSGGPADLAISAYYLNLADQHWWEYTEKNANAPARVECRQRDGKLHVMVTVAARTSEHVFDVRTYDAPGVGPVTEFTLLQSRMLGHEAFVTWHGGLAIPALWPLGQVLHGVSDGPGNPATGNKVAVTLTLRRHGTLPPPALVLEGIEVEYVITDVGLGARLQTIKLSFAGGRGLVYAGGELCGWSVAASQEMVRRRVRRPRWYLTG